MAVTTLEEELLSINSAIDHILNSGQDVSSGNSRLQMANLDILYRRKDTVEKRIARKVRGGIRVTGATPV